MPAPIITESDVYADDFPLGAALALPSKAAGRYSTVTVANVHPFRALTLEAAPGEGILPGPTVGGEPSTQVYANEIVFLRRVLDGLSWYVFVRAPVQAALPPPPPPVPPVNVQPPVITGVQLEGETLTVTPGVWVGESPVLTYQWRRNGIDLGGETALTYVVQPADVGQLLDARETADGDPLNYADTQEVYVYDSAALYDVAACGWAEAARTLATGTPAAPTSVAESWAFCVWQNGTRTLTG